MEKLISVIVPVYNVEKYIKQCVESICAQTYKNLEIILINDGSKDNSGAICDTLAEKDSRIYVIHKENGGVSAARNAGLDYAHGEYIAFIDGDDYIEPTMYEKLEEKMKEETDIVFGYFQREYPDGGISYYTDNYEEKYLHRPWDIRPMLCGGVTLNGEKIEVINCGIWRNLFKKANIEKLDLRFDTRIKMGEDRIFLIQYLNKCNKAALIKEALYHYRKEREDSACTSNSIKIGLDYEHETNKWRLKSKALELNSRLSIDEKKYLKLFLDKEYFLSFVCTQILHNKKYRVELKKYNQQDEVKILKKQFSINALKKIGCNLREILLVKLCKWRCYALIKLLKK